jgi:hypothetical protein
MEPSFDLFDQRPDSGKPVEIPLEAVGSRRPGRHPQSHQPHRQHPAAGRGSAKRSRARKKLQAQGRGLLVNHSLPAPAHWWKPQTWARLLGLLPG